MKCENCETQNASKICSKCKVATYCSKECQISHWKFIHKTECGKSKEDILFEEAAKKNAPTASVDMIHKMMSMTMKHSSNPQAAQVRNIMALYEKTPDLVSEFKKFFIDKNDVGILKEQYLKLLEDVVVGNKGQFLKELVFYKESDVNEVLLLEPQSLVKRLNSVSKEKLDWYMHAAAGDVFSDENARPYEESIFHSFSNARARKERFETGKTHVAVGFVDLSLLLWMDLQMGHTPGPFRFIGFEQSAYSVAKTMVISSMLGSKSKGIVDAILQVWYSSSWSDCTLQLFRNALPNAISMCDNSQVLEILNHWYNVAPLSLKVARRDWFGKIGSNLFDPAVNALKLKTRNHLVQYFLTGELLPSTVASIVMFSVPAKYNNRRSRDESCFHSLDIQQLVLHAKENDDDFVAGAISLLRERIKSLNKLVLDKVVSIQIEAPTMVSLEHPQVYSYIAGLHPFTISWNNCLDYMSMQDFHQLARLCSAPEDTVHYGYSMNWPCNVKGAMCLDLPTGPYLEEGFESTRASISMGYSMIGLDDLFISPPIDNPINILNHFTFITARYHWQEVFFQDVPNVSHVEPTVIFNVFSRSNSCLFFTWTYDDSICFNPL